MMALHHLFGTIWIETGAGHFFRVQPGRLNIYPPGLFVYFGPKYEIGSATQPEVGGGPGVIGANRAHKLEDSLLKEIRLTRPA